MGDKIAYTRKCAKCGKEIFITPEWVYKRTNKYYCTWKCFNSVNKEQSKRKLILPNVGDSIRIKTISGIPDYSNKVGVVEFYDSFGQLHGTWGNYVVVPSMDDYEIIGGENDG